MRRYCSLRCAEAAEEAGGAPPSWTPALPALPRRILVAVDGSGPSLRAVEAAVALAVASRGEVRLLHAVDPSWIRGRGLVPALADATSLGVGLDRLEELLRKDGEAQLELPRRICAQAGVPHSHAVALRPPLPALIEAAEGVDLVVIGSRGMGAVSGALLGSLSHRLIGGVRAPVLVVH
jgi:nucleotide-binding universal stress UspA family protein